MAAAERGKIGPVVGVGPLGRRRVVRRCEVVLNGPRELGEDRAAALERLDRGQRVPASAVSGDRAGLRAVRGRFPRLLLSKLVVVPVPEKAFFSGTRTTLTCGTGRRRSRPVRTSHAVSATRRARRPRRNRASKAASAAADLQHDDVPRDSAARRAALPCLPRSSGAALPRSPRPAARDSPARRGPPAR